MRTSLNGLKLIIWLSAFLLLTTMLTQEAPAQRKRIKKTTETANDSLAPLKEGFFFDGVYLETMVDMSVNSYHNLSLLPREYLMFYGFGLAVPFLRSGRDIALGAQFQVKYGRSLTLERVSAYSLPIFITVRFGSNSQHESQADIGFGAGFGAEYYLNVESGIGVKENELRPSYFLEFNGSILGRNAFLRYGQMITSGFVTKTTIQFGMFLGLATK